jgi:hypothetical protein
MLLHLMRDLVYTCKRDQCIVFVEKGQDIAPHGLLAAVERQQKLLSVTWPILRESLSYPILDRGLQAQSIARKGALKQ